MSCNCHQYPPCDPQCPSCNGTTTTSTTTTTTLCPSSIKCVEYKKDICVIHPGDPCYNIKSGANLNTLIVSILRMLPNPPGCSTTTTTRRPTTTTTSTTRIPTTTTTTCICASTTTSTSTSTTTTTTLAPCDCLTFTIKNITASTQTYSYTNCSHVRFSNVSIAAGVTHTICVCNEDLVYDRAKFIVIAGQRGCNLSTTTTSSTSTTSTTSSSTTTTTTNPCPACNTYKIQSTSLPASWIGKRCDDGVVVSYNFTSVGQIITTPCICSTSLVVSNASVKETTNCIGTTTTSTSTSTTSTTTAAPITTTTTIACLQYILSSPTGGYAVGTSCTGEEVIISVPIVTPVVTPCVQVGSLVLNEAVIDYTIPCGGTTSTTTSSTTTTTLPACECFSIENPTEFTEGAVIIPCGSSSPLEVSIPAFTINSYCVKYGTVPYEQSGSSLNIVRCYTFTCTSNVDCTGCVDTTTTIEPTTTTTTEIPTTTTTTI